MWTDSRAATSLNTKEKTKTKIYTFPGFLTSDLTVKCTLAPPPPPPS